MNQVNMQQENQTLVIHYYLNDNSHSMNALNRNAMEKDFLNLILEIGQTLNINLKIESQAREEGGLKEILAIAVAGTAFFSRAINDIAIHYLTGKHKLQQLDLQLKKEELKIKQEQTKQSQIKTQKDELELQILKEEFINRLENNHKIQRHLSGFYQKAQKYEKIQKIGYQINNNNEEVISRDKFNTFILHDTKDVEIVENARIEIISPVLKEGKYKWRGLYENEKIDFSMGDSGFKSKVVEQKYNFKNGTIIVCEMHINKTFNEFGEEGTKTYSVRKVYDFIIDNIVWTTPLGKKRKDKQEQDNERNLFSMPKEEDEKE